MVDDLEEIEEEELFEDAVGDHEIEYRNFFDELALEEIKRGYISHRVLAAPTA